MTGLTLPASICSRDSMIGLFRAGGFSVSLTHHVMQTGSRVMGFTQELFNDSRTADPELQAAMMREMGGRFPNVLAIATAASHEGESVVGQGCDDQFEFEVALDLLLEDSTGVGKTTRIAKRRPLSRRR